MKTTTIIGLTAIASVATIGCGKKKSSTDTTTTSTSGSSGSPAAGASVAIANLASVPDADSFLKSLSSSASLQASLALTDRGDGYSLTTGTPPNFSDIQSDMATVLTGDISTISSAITTAQQSQDWAGMQTQAGKFFDAEAKCAVIEHSAHIIQRLRQDTAPLCLLKTVGPVGDKVYRVVSGAPIADLTKVFVPDTSDKILQIGLTDKNQPHYEMVKITGTSTNPNGFHAVYSTCLTTTKKAFRQNVIDIDASGNLTFTATNNGERDDKGPKPSATFSLKGAVVSDGNGNMIADTSKGRTVAYSGSGAFGQLTATEQGILDITSNELKATFFVSETGKDQQQNSISRTDKTALDVQYSGSSSSDLVIYQGAGHSLMTMTGTVNGTSETHSNDHTIGFDFDNTASPHYTTATSSTYLTSLANVDFTTDTLLKQTTPTAPDMSTIDDGACTDTPTTTLSFVDKPEDNTTYSAAMTSCNTFPAEKSASMCDSLRDKEHAINDALHAREQVKGKANF